MTENRADRVPTPAECQELMAQYSMLPNIVKHSRQVMNVSLAIADNLKSGVSVDRNLIMAAALLHDITKTRSIKTREHHDESGGALLRSLGFHSTAEIVEQHVIMKELHASARLEEREIVYYADKRVLHDGIVTVEERVLDLLRRYGTTEGIRNQILQNKIQALAVERKIAGVMAIDLNRALNHNCSQRG